jgi:uncharacterized membrane protein YfcA
MVYFLAMTGLGALVGLVIGLTGEGSGSFLTPMLILLAGLPPAQAVGTSLAFGFITKLYGTWSFSRGGLVRMDLVKMLVYVGVPGALAGGLLVHYVGLHSPHALNLFLLRAIGSILIVVSLLMILKLVPYQYRPGIERPAFFAGRKFHGLLLFVGFIIGMVVSTTSIGSGALVVAALTILFPIDSGSLVGTAVVTGMVLIAVSSLPYAAMGNIDWRLVVPLLCGSLPAIHFASRLHGRLPKLVPEGLIATTMMAIGVRILLF